MKEKISSWFSALGGKLTQLKNWFLLTKFWAFIEKIVRYISVGLRYVFYPITWIKKRTYDRMRYDNQKVFASILFLTPVLLGFFLFFAYPIIMSFIYSFSEVTIFDGKTQILFGQYLEGPKGEEVAIKDLFHNYKFALQGHGTFIIELWNTVQTTVIDTVVITIFSLLIAVMLNGEYKGRGFVRAVFFLPVVFNSEALDTALEATEAIDQVLTNAGTGSGELAKLFDLTLFMESIGVPVWLVTFLSDITGAIYRTITYSGVQILVFLAAIQSVPGHLYEAAKIEGATAYESFWKITLPMVSPQIVTVVVYTIVDSFLRSEINTIIDYQFVQNEIGYHAAMSWLYVIVSVIILAVAVGILNKVVFYQDDKK
ncbi:MAG: sugar ABC transporter permease [Bacilli bacterium]|nr:sugar ABC transporter permease [Bacilli bacterium]